MSIRRPLPPGAWCIKRDDPAFPPALADDPKPPVRIQGGAALRGIRYEMPVASAQVKSAVLLAGLYADGETTVVEPAVAGTPRSVTYCRISSDELK